jgi:hypothetical protein
LRQVSSISFYVFDASDIELQKLNFLKHQSIYQEFHTLTRSGVVLEKIRVVPVFKNILLISYMEAEYTNNLASGPCPESHSSSPHTSKPFIFLNEGFFYLFNIAFYNPLRFL